MKNKLNLFLKKNGFLTLLFLCVCFVAGEIITDFVADSLIYSETLGEWRTHLGIDIKAGLNTTVRAPLGGVIKSVYEDELWGKVIVIDHGNGLESKFANLGTLEMVKEGLEVSQGDHISTVRQAAGEFGVSKSTVRKDVTERLPKINPLIAAMVKNVLETNKAERHIRGGKATKLKYKSIKS